MKEEYVYSECCNNEIFSPDHSIIEAFYAKKDDILKTYNIVLWFIQWFLNMWSSLNSVGLSAANLYPSYCPKFPWHSLVCLRKFSTICRINLHRIQTTYEVYAFTRDDVIKSFELWHSFILDKLKCDREAIAMELFEEEKEDGKQLVSDLTKKQY